MECRLQYPKLQTIGTSNSVLGICNYARTTEEDVVIFDLSKTEFITPFGIVLLSGVIAECITNGKKAKYRRPTKAKTKNFLSAIGFNKFFSLTDEGHKIESPQVQLRRLNAVDYLLTDQILEVFDFSLNLSDGVKGSLKMALNELMINVFDHSESIQGCYVCAQSYPQSKKIKLCIADFGIGILRSLQKDNKYRMLQNDYEAIELAIEEGVTSRPSGDAGKGLSHINRFIKVNEGKMYILSGAGKVLWDFSERKTKHQTMRTFFHGTIVKLEINADREGFYFLRSAEGDIF